MNTINYATTYPELSQEGQERTQEIINKFGQQITELMNNTVSDFTRNLAAEIVNDDSWIDIRQKTLEALAGYGEHERSMKANGTYLGQWWVSIRRKIFEENREEIIQDIIADKDAEIESLKTTIDQLQRMSRY